MHPQVLNGEYDTFASIDDDGLRLLTAALNQPLAAARTEVYYPNDDRKFVDGPLELTFGADHLFKVTDAHAGLCVVPYEVCADPDTPSVPSELRSLTEAATAVGESCRDIELLLESTEGLHGNNYLTSGLLFRFSSTKIGVENFEHLHATSRSSVVINPGWFGHKRLSLGSGTLIT